MSSFARTAPSRAVLLLCAGLAVLLAIRFSASAILAGMSLPAETLAAVGGALEVYDALLPLPLLVGTFVLLRSQSRSLPRAAVWGFLGFHAFAVGLGTLSAAFSGGAWARDAIPFLGLASVASASTVAGAVARIRLGASADWRAVAAATFLVAVPLAYVMRMAAHLGVGTAPGEGGVLQGNWVLVNLPTLLLELLVVGVWLNLLFDSDRRTLRRRWYALLPLAAIPGAAWLFAARPLSGYILSALITWGSDLALFAPASISLTLAVAAATCYVSAFLLPERRGERWPRNLLFVGTLSALLAGFYSTIPSAEGLSFALLATATAYRGLRGADGVVEGGT